MGCVNGGDTTANAQNNIIYKYPFCFVIVFGRVRDECVCVYFIYVQSPRASIYVVLSCGERFVI